MRRSGAARFLALRPVLPLVPVLLFVLLIVLLPAGIVFGAALAGGGGLVGLLAVFADPLNQRALGNSLLQGGASAVLAGAIGYPAGLIMGRYSFAGRSPLRAFLLVPFLLPTLVVVVGFEELLGPAGYGPALWPALGGLGRGLVGILAVNVYFTAVMVCLLTAAAVETAPHEQEEAVATLGGSPFRAYLETWGPPSWAGALAGMTLTFLLSALGFAAPLVVCGPGCYTLEVRIWSLAEVLGGPVAAGLLALATFLLLSLPVLGYVHLLRRRRPRWANRSRTPPPLRWRDRRSWPALAYITLFFGVIFLLLGVILLRSVTTVAAAPSLSGWTMLLAPTTARRLGISTPAAGANSLFFASGAALVALLLAVLAAYASRSGWRRGAAAEYLLFLPLLISPVLLAFGLATFWRPLLGGAASTWVWILFSQAALALPFSAQTLRLGLDRVPKGPWEAARLLGSGPFAAHLDVELPRLGSAVSAAALFAFAFGFGEFTATYFLVLPQFTTWPVELYELPALRLGAAAPALAGLLVLVSLASFTAIEGGIRRLAR
ncbi:MAG: ABC transporter permease [Thermoplasmata archaeon]